MKTLPSTLRKQLERTVADAREIAESGSRATLEALAVHHRDPYGHMGAEQRVLRRRLRAHARQLGDRRDARSGNQAIDRLVHECAYEHWHGMLFARFLAENRLLIEPGLGVAVTLDECEELAKDGRGSRQRSIHVVCSPKEDYLAIITAYLPSRDEWRSDLRTRKTS